MVSKQDQLVYEMVLERDRVMFWNEYVSKFDQPMLSLAEWLTADPWVCVAVIIDPSEWGTCSGEMTRDHVHEHTGGTKGKRAVTTMETVIILCRHHHLNGWATSHRDILRTYIKEANARYEAWIKTQPRDPIQAALSQGRAK
jgi:hypothetical protein